MGNIQNSNENKPGSETSKTKKIKLSTSEPIEIIDSDVEETAEDDPLKQTTKSDTTNVDDKKTSENVSSEKTSEDVIVIDLDDDEVVNPLHSPPVKNIESESMEISNEITPNETKNDDKVAESTEEISEANKETKEIEKSEDSDQKEDTKNEPEPMESNDETKTVVEIIDLDEDDDETQKRNKVNPTSTTEKIEEKPINPESQAKAMETDLNEPPSDNSKKEEDFNSTINQISEVLTRLETSLKSKIDSKEKTKNDVICIDLIEEAEAVKSIITDPVDSTQEQNSSDLIKESTSINPEVMDCFEKSEEIEKPKQPEDHPMDEPVIEIAEIKENESNSDIELKECIHYNCEKKSKIYHSASNFILSHYRVNKNKNKKQFVCDICYDEAIAKYEELSNALLLHKPLLLENLPKQAEVLEISDSESDEEVEKSLELNNENYFDKDNCLEMLNDEVLTETITNTLAKINVTQQIEFAVETITERVQVNNNSLDEILSQLKDLQKSANNMHMKLYQHQGRVIKELPPLDLNLATEEVENTDPNIPPIGKIIYPPLKVNEQYLAPRMAGGAYILCILEKIFENGHPQMPKKNSRLCKVMFIKKSVSKVISPKHMAYIRPPQFRLPVGVRVIAIYQQQFPSVRNAFFPGVIGETLMAANKFRYLIFFNDGYFRYVRHDQVRLICNSSENIGEDIDINPNSDRRKFIETYINQYKANRLRPMVQAKKGQKIITEYNGQWKNLRITDIDCNLFLVFSEERNSYEWIFRGSSRFAPVFKEINTNRTEKNQINFKRKNNEPYIEYVRTVDDFMNGNNVENQITSSTTRAVARKSTNSGSNYQTQSQLPVAPQMQPPQIKYMNSSIIVVDDEQIQRGKVIYYTATKTFKPKKYTPHKCDNKCLYEISDNLAPFNPIARPLLSGWERQICKTKTRKIAIYRAPCGKRLRNMNELHRYLRMTNSPLNVECFDYDTTIHCLAEFVDDAKYIRNTDLSNGIEKMPISCCNYFDNTVPPHCEYSSQRIPREGCTLNLDPEFLCGCDCEDDCADKSKCQCWQLTIAGAKFGNPNVTIDEIGYCYKRLSNPVQTGIYECNSRCKCSKDCLNRVVQHPLSVKLQVFKTTTRGWGLRTLHDIPKGSFICIYAGDLLTEQLSNEFGKAEGDEYFAELDYIEVVERIKEGYESDVPEEPEELEDDDEFDPKESEKGSIDSDYDDEDFTATVRNNPKKRITTRASLRNTNNTNVKNVPQMTNAPSTNNLNIKTEVKSKSNPKITLSDKSKDNNADDECILISDDEDIREPVNFMPSNSYDATDEVEGKYKSVRKMFGKDELGYVMDAKRVGNIGRYFNHSCNPNLFVQNVFVDTHDLRFPWVTFFASVAIPASTELTWNYNYDVGCVPGKVLYCQCLSANCRGRLL